MSLLFAARQKGKGQNAYSVTPLVIMVLMVVASCSFDGTDGNGSCDTFKETERAKSDSTKGALKDEASFENEPEKDLRKGWDLLRFSVRTNPFQPDNEVYLKNWTLRLFSINYRAELNGSTYYGQTDALGNAEIYVPSYLIESPVLVVATNDIIPFTGCADGECTELEDASGENTCRQLEIFIPPYCFDKVPSWLVAPLENAVWRYYVNAAARYGEGWNTTQVDCASWLANMEHLYLTDTIEAELNNLNMNGIPRISAGSINSDLAGKSTSLIPTRPPICMSEFRYDGGGMDGGEIVTLPIVLDDGMPPFIVGNPFFDPDPIEISKNGIVSEICHVPLSGVLAVNGVPFEPYVSNRLKDKNFIGVISRQAKTVLDTDVSVFNTKLGNGRELDSEIYQDACALTSVIEFTNTATDEKILAANATGVTFFDLFGAASNTIVYLTSDGDAVVDDEDFWAIFYKEGSHACEEQVLVAELLGHRREDFRDVLTMDYNVDEEDLFLGLRADYELNTNETDGERAFLSYTLHVWDGSADDAHIKLRSQLASCYLAADPWALQFIRVRDSELEDVDVGVNCSPFCPLVLAEFAARSQCFSNSRSNQRWQSDNAGYWSINSIFNVNGNLIINPGWLGPNLDFDIYVQKFNETVFKGPRTIRRTDEVGQMMIEMPTIVEGDRVMIKAQNSCCDDYSLVVPCVPDFTGFAGASSLP